MIYILFVERWTYKIKNKLKPDQNEFLIELAHIYTYPKYLEFRDQHGQPRQQHPYVSASMITVLSSPIFRSLV